MHTFGVWGIVIVAMVGAIATPAAGQRKGDVSFVEAKLAEAPETRTPAFVWVKFGPLGHRVAYAVRTETDAGPREELHVAHRDGSLMAGRAYLAVDQSTFHFTPDGAHFAYRARTDAAAGRLAFQVVLKDHKPAGTAPFVSAPVLSDNGADLAWTVRSADGLTSRVMRNGTQVGEDYEDVLAFIHTGPYREDHERQWTIGTPLRFAAGSSRLAFVGELLGPGDLAGREEVRWGKYRSTPWLSADFLVFSPNGKRLAYSADPLEHNGDRTVVIVDGKPLKTPFARAGAPAFGPKSKRVAYKAEHDGGWIVVELGRKPSGEAWVVTGQIVFRPDGKAVAYRGNRGGRNLSGQIGVHGTAFGGKWHVVNAGTAGAAWDWVTDPMFDASGKHCAYAAWSGGPNPTGLELRHPVAEGKWRVVVDEKPGPEHDAVGGLRFSPDGSTVAYIAREGDELFVIAGELRSEAHRAIPTRPIWNADGTHVAYGVTVKRRELWWKVLGSR